MSGGVDSSVTAALLKAEGYDVVGVTLQLYDHGAATHRKGACCAGQDIHDARAVAERIGIPHYVLDYERRFKEMVIDRFAESYVRARLRAVCRLQHVDQVPRSLVDRARTGRQGSGDRSLRRLACAAGRRARALPGARGRAGPELLPVRHHARAARPAAVPLGERGKAETRELARRFGLPVADKRDSQDICFVPSGRYTEVIERLKPGAAEPGDIVDVRQAAWPAPGHYSLHRRAAEGPRHRPVIRSTWCGSMRYRAASRGTARPVAHVPHDAARGELDRRGTLEHVLADERREVFVKVRSTRPPQAAWLSRTDGQIEVELIGGEDGVSPGQACVFYDAPHGQARVLGGGFIQSAVAAPDTMAKLIGVRSPAAPWASCSAPPGAR